MQAGTVQARANDDPLLELQQTGKTCLYAYVEALGGKLEIRARFPNREIQIKQYGDVEKLRAALTPRTRQKESA